MSCEEFVELVTEYLERAMLADERARFEEHIASCPWCSRYLDQMEVTLRSVGRIEGESLSPTARNALLHAFRDWHTEHPAP
jgi:hypothetical protein